MRFNVVFKINKCHPQFRSMISIDLLSCGKALATDTQPNLKLLWIPH